MRSTTKFGRCRANCRGASSLCVINIFVERVGTPLVKRNLTDLRRSCWREDFDILITAANDSREPFLGELLVPSAYIAVIWTSMACSTVIVVLAKVFIPAIADSNAGGGDGGDSGDKTSNADRAIDPLFFLTIFYYGVTMLAATAPGMV